MALFLATFSVTAMAAQVGRSPKEVLAHHISVVKKDDVDGIMLDYAENVVVVDQTKEGNKTLIGKADVRKYFEAEAAQHYDWKSYIVTQEVQADGVVLQKEVKSGDVEVFVVRNGKIVFQVMKD